MERIEKQRIIEATINTLKKKGLLKESEEELYTIKFYTPSDEKRYYFATRTLPQFINDYNQKPTKNIEEFIKQYNDRGSAIAAVLVKEGEKGYGEDKFKAEELKKNKKYPGPMNLTKPYEKKPNSKNGILKKVLNTLIASDAGPQENSIIGAYDVAKDARKHFEESSVEVSPELLEFFITDFEKNVKPETIEDEFYDEETDKLYFENEKLYKVARLKKYELEVPEGFSYFALYPVDYNRYGMNDIVICYFTQEGKKYAKYITGDY